MAGTTKGWFYLHTSGDLIWKGAAYTDEGDLRESPFVVMFWPFYEGDREQAWTTLVEARAAGANRRRVLELAAKWGCTDEDAAEYVRRIDVTAVRDPRDGNRWLVVPPAGGRAAVVGGAIREWLAGELGRGDTILEALAALAVAIGWSPMKTGGESFPVKLHRLANFSSPTPTQEAE